MAAPPIQFNVDLNMSVGDAVVFVGKCILAVGLTLALCSCRWCTVRVVYVRQLGALQDTRAGAQEGTGVNARMLAL